MDACAISRCRHGLFVAVALAWPLSIRAAEPMPAVGPEKPAAVLAPASTALGDAVADDALSGLRGGEALVVVSVDNQGNVAGNTATNVASGDNRIDGGAFANASGLQTVIQNSGSNVLIQNGTSINVRFADPGL